MSITYYASGSMLNKAFGATNYTPPAALYAALSTTHFSSSGSNGTEPVGNGYARVAIVNDKSGSGFTNAISGSVTNASAITWPESLAAWGTILDVGFFDSPTTGNLWFFQALGSTKTIDANTVLQINAGSLIISMLNS
jgi:hypothetical protein